MNTAFLVLTSLAALLALGGYLLYRRTQLAWPTVDQYELYLDRGPERHRHLWRLFAAEDFEYVTAAGGRAMAGRLDRERRRLLRAVLGDLRRDFEAIQAVGGMLSASPTAQADGFRLHIIGQGLLFYALYTLVLLRSLIPLWMQPRFDATPIMDHVRALRQTTSVLLNSLTDDDLAVLRAGAGG
jgi:hypothetical protein